jgi:sensor domain CHASE-containing protein
MKIRSHLLIFILGAVLPILAFSAVMTTVFWREQRQSLEQRFLDRVRGMTIALDREIDGNIRSLQMLAESPHLQSNDLLSFYEQIAGSFDATYVGKYYPERSSIGQASDQSAISVRRAAA